MLLTWHIHTIRSPSHVGFKGAVFDILVSPVVDIFYLIDLFKEPIDIVIINLTAHLQLFLLFLLRILDSRLWVHLLLNSSFHRHMVINGDTHRFSGKRAVQLKLWLLLLKSLWSDGLDKVTACLLE